MNEKFEFVFVGYMNCKDKETALKRGYEMEDALGYLTKDNLSLYLADVNKTKKMGTTPNQLQEWINHLDPEEMNLPIRVSHKIFPQEIDKMEVVSIGKHVSAHGDPEFILVCKNHDVSDYLHQKDIKIKELKKDLVKKDNIIKASNRIIDMYVPEDEHDFVAEVINDAMEERNEL